VANSPSFRILPISQLLESFEFYMYFWSSREEAAVPLLHPYRYSCTWASDLSQKVLQNDTINSIFFTINPIISSNIIQITFCDDSDENWRQNFWNLKPIFKSQFLD